ncbi:6,7-dimethyl-8-ribityllumazine synthase [Methylobacterium sp. Leaf469]|uniref:6,7-dimethyl-8-ribityllumazine synthase n=1 Tax=unclassified Methylobacterium TaxID=2615210 RepID=UPI0006F32517|nr:MULTISPECIES: 6,7-dimethyl-8-ribityllumazine synthase [unclassified Methylobacterium]KQO72858.1 6,7-dimethyl-8-ribityllumazine synthase [Methylobacterium sp. Leaf87]KQP30225.1 6,7-dimethyl-8-ribityllumazine synthase [Methylobacterium sp. Leaf102]KQP32154.1 6,7-dimethyl-8-ribityllumazine synthase [Methylobacterium sp. Leaf100]KQP65935.1 6,7-dimethyl-8-ribityllumazine synthase [Methylobacterium sp. Leaf112]KQT98977.1 6,7-dimethyl-8-ribityllumazine synthase [Methylobacterium sp. Leaf469]
MVSTQHVPRPSPAIVRGARVLVVEARYYDELADAMLAGARATLDAAEAETTVVTVPGALEIPAAIAILVEAAARAGQPYDAAVALGCVIRGETGHYDIVANESARALMDLSVARLLPLGNGILTVETEAQAFARARVSELNKGGGAAEAALAVLALKRAAAAAPVGED